MEFNLDKYQYFLEALRTEENSNLIDTISNGFKVCFEAEITEKDDKVFINPRLLSKTELNKINTYMKRKGYDWRGPEDALALLMKTTHVGYAGDMADAIRSAVAPPKKQDISTKAARHFGVTTNPLEAGYMTPRGLLLNFSGGSPNSRGLDHSDINAVTDKSGWEGKLDFMKSGNIRMSPETGGIQLVLPPTKEQYGSLGTWFKYFKDKDIPVSITTEDGDRGFDKEYRAKTNYMVILRDINSYFSKNG